MSPQRTPTALVTGANRGIGLEVCRQLLQRGLRVVLTARGVTAAEAAARALRDTEPSATPRGTTHAGAPKPGTDALATSNLHWAQLDVAEEGAAATCARALTAVGVTIDVLVNNAGIYPPGELLATSPATLRETLEVNLLGAIWACQAFVPAMLRAGYGRVVNVSSGSGSFAEELEGPAAYCISKTALNAMTVKLAQEIAAARADVKVNAVCPGWVRTRMGGQDAERDVQAGADTIVWLATLPASGPSGGFFRDQQLIDW